MPPGTLRTLLHEVRRPEHITARMPAVTLHTLLPNASPHLIAPETTLPVGVQPPHALVIAISCVVTLAIGFAVIALV